MPTQTPTRVLCLGGGWVALQLARSLSRAVARGEVQLTILSRENYQTTHGLIAEMITSKVQPQQILTSVRRLVPEGSLCNAEIERIDLAERVVHTRRELDGHRYSHGFDHLVVGVGSVDDLSRYPGIAEHAFALKSYAACVRLRHHLLSMIELAQFERDPAERRRLLTFVVAGGNYAGVEVACDLVDYFRLLTRRAYQAVKPEEIRVVLAEMGDRILPELGSRQPKLIAYAEQRMAELGIEVKLGAGIAAATGTEASLTTGERVPSRTIITCTGMAPSPLLEQLPYARDGRGRLEVDEFMRVPGAEHVWAAGDCAAAPHPEGGTCPPLALYAQRGGALAGANILRTLAGRRLKAFSFSGLGEACTLGHGSAVAYLKGIRVTGWLAWIGWRAIIWTMFVPAWDRKVRLLADWLLTACLGRDVVNPRIEGRHEVSQAWFEAGQVILAPGEPSLFHYVVQTGEVEVLTDGATETLRAGALFCDDLSTERRATVRARSRVRLLAVEKTAAAAVMAARPDVAALLSAPAGGV
ncbi:MAG TPA: FAD-dependent oxidoreductase [Chthoniobacteraceae bacterium]|jgi:NADH dehydrogenase|nr:FAD-dependent oxidoreductase [Chthoniobacteraceae bacterium]